MTEYSLFNSSSFYESIIRFIDISPLFAYSFITSFGLLSFLLIKRLFVKTNWNLKIVSIRINKLFLSSTLMVASLSGWIAERKFSTQAGLLLFGFVFFFLMFIALLFKSNDRRIDR